MAKKQEFPYNVTEQGFSLDLEEKKRQADLQNAQFIAQMMYQRLKTEMEVRGYLVKPIRDEQGVWTGEFEPDIDPTSGQPKPTIDAANQAKEIALREAEFEFNKVQSGLDYALKQQQFALQQEQFAAQFGLQKQEFGLQQQRFASEDAARRAEEAARQAQLSGYMQGAPTLERERFQAEDAARQAALSGYTARQLTYRGGEGIVDGWYDQMGRLVKQGPNTGVPPGIDPSPTLAREQFMTDATGYVGGLAGGAPTLQRETQIAGLTGYLGGQTTLDRERLMEQQRQANLNAVMNAPRGPADYAAYLNRLRGLNQRGELPGILSSFVQGQPIAAQSNAGERTPVPLSNTNLALGLTGAGGQDGAGGRLGGADAGFAGGQNYAGGSAGFNEQTGTYGGSPYGGTSAGIERMYAPVSGQQQSQEFAGSRSWSPTEYEKLSPVEQQYLLGANAEYNSEPMEDALWNIKQSGANFRPGKRATILGVG